MSFFISELLGGCADAAALEKANVSRVAGRMVSVLPCLNAEVLQDS